MSFCPNCGAEQPPENRFCSACGKSLKEPSEPVTSRNAAGDNEEKVLWEGKPSGLGGRMKEAAHVNSTIYTITSQRVIIKYGLLDKKQEEIELFRVKDYKMIQSLQDRILGIGDIQIISTDPTAPVLEISDIRDPGSVKEILRKAIRAEKDTFGVKYEERL